jgi:hypothetical protein
MTPIAVAGAVFTVGAFGVSDTYASSVYRCYNAVNCSGASDGMNAAEVRNESGSGLVGRIWALLNGQWVLRAIGSCEYCDAGELEIPYLEEECPHAETERWYRKYEHILGGTQFIQT